MEELADRMEKTVERMLKRMDEVVELVVELHAEVVMRKLKHEAELDNMPNKPHQVRGPRLGQKIVGV